MLFLSIIILFFWFSFFPWTPIKLSGWFITLFWISTILFCGGFIKSFSFILYIWLNKRFWLPIKSFLFKFKLFCSVIVGIKLFCFSIGLFCSIIKFFFCSIILFGFLIIWFWRFSEILGCSIIFCWPNKLLDCSTILFWFNGILVYPTIFSGFIILFDWISEFGAIKLFGGVIISFSFVSVFEEYWLVIFFNISFVLFIGLGCLFGE